MNKTLLKISLRLRIYRYLRALNDWLRHRAAKESETAFFRELIKPGDLVFDVGANRGQSAETFLKLGASVIAFEPQGDLHEEIRQRCSHLGKLSIKRMGLGREKSTLELILKDCDQVASFDPDWEGTPIGKVSVEVSTLDEEIRRHGLPDYIKIDTEGWEHEVVAGLHTQVPLLSIEYHLTSKNLTETKNAILSLAAKGESEANFRQAGEQHWSLPQWIRTHEFLEKFPDDFRFNSHYGEIFIRAKSDQATSK